MLTPITPEDLTEAGAGQDDAYRCWAVAYPLYETSSIVLGSHDATSPRLALRWLRERTSNVTDQLDTAYGQPGRYWLRDEREHERALTYLTTGTAYQHPARREHALRPRGLPARSDLVNGYIRGFWCECWTEDPTRTGQPAFHSSFDAHSAGQADRWIAIALRTLTPALDSRACDEAWEWLYEGRIETRKALLCSEPCTVTINQGGTRISWTARPVLFLPLAHRRSLELPSCAFDFKPHATD